MDVDVDPDNTNPFGEGTSNTGGDDAGESFPMEERGTSSRRGSEDIADPFRDKTRDEDSFLTGIDEHTPFISKDGSKGKDRSKAEESLKDMERGKDEAERRILEKFPEAKFTNPIVLAWIDDHDRIMVKLGGKGKREQPLFVGDKVNKKVNDTIRKSLGPLAEKVVESNEEKIAKATAKLRERQSALETADENQRESINHQINDLENEIDGLERENEVIEHRMSLRDRIKAIFKKYGFTLIGALAAVGTVIGVIVSNLKQGLTTLGKGVGSGLKSIGKKLGEILPGLVGAIASFVFKTAGEVIGFLGKNAWLLIVGVVVFLIERLKKKIR